MVEVRTTVRSKYEAFRIARALVESKKSSSVHIKEVSSVYRWKGKVIGTSEYELGILTSDKLIDVIIESIKKLNKYELPEVLVYKVESTDEFNEWCENSCE